MGSVGLHSNHYSQSASSTICLGSMTDFFLSYHHKSKHGEWNLVLWLVGFV